LPRDSVHPSDLGLKTVLRMEAKKHKKHDQVVS